MIVREQAQGIDGTVRLGRQDPRRGLQLVELRRSMFSSDEAFQEAIDFHLERGCEELDGGRAPELASAVAPGARIS